VSYGVAVRYCTVCGHKQKRNTNAKTQIMQDNWRDDEKYNATVKVRKLREAVNDPS
jgi:hypothetical protein